MDQGTVSGNGQLPLASSTISTAAVEFLELHTAGTTNANNNASALNAQGPGDTNYVDPSSYGTKPDGSAITAIYVQNFGSLGLFSMKNPAAILFAFLIIGHFLA